MITSKPFASYLSAVAAACALVLSLSPLFVKAATVCLDGDKDDIYKRGTTKVESDSAPDQKYRDECTSVVVLKESFCNASRNYATREVSCAFGCRSGACRKESQFSCKDSDKADAFRRGTTKMTSIVGEKTSIIDTCNGDFALTEFSCNATGMQSASVSCQFGCKKGACNKKSLASCRDSDGDNTKKRGSVKVVTLIGDKPPVLKDTCETDTSVREYTCSGSGSTSRVATCTKGCKNGACKK